MATSELSWSSFLRSPTRVEPLLERGDVLLRRRDGESVRLTRASSEDALREAATVVGRLFTRSMDLDAGAVADRLPWTRFLPDDDRKLFIRELLTALEACADLGDFSAVGRLIADWKATAKVHAEGLADTLTRSVVEPEDRPVKRP